MIISTGVPEKSIFQSRGMVSGEVKVDNIPIAKLSALDYVSNVISKVTEIYAKKFNATIPSNSQFQVEKPGIFPAVAHGWFVFLMPVTPGNYTIYYQNTVEPTTLIGPSNVNNAQITYSMDVK